AIQNRKHYGVTIFSKIIAGDIASYKVAESDRFFAFLDIFPLREGHTLVIPKLEIDRFFDLGDDYLAGLVLFAKPIALAIEKAFPCNRCGVSVVGLEVPHAHLHLVPIDRADDLNFTRPKLKPTPDQMRSAQEKILRHLHP
ncbi:MAG TPA: HIT family protein, partial [Puia sp.]|nr:HIT family protein [Puia sp.]